MPTTSPLSRRSFLNRTGLAAAAGAAPWVIPGRALGKAGQPAPSERVTVGMIGTGRQAFLVNLQRQFIKMPDEQVVALCDVDRWRLAEVQKFVEKSYAAGQPSGQYKGCATYKLYQELLGRDDIDAVMISTPDHWHTKIAIDAAAAGKHVALEKPIIR
ncbi:MAG: Gfo/Idh/MocA family oxidoreductase, partial [Thermoguttaceae bacterium]|nr:Gfo/Idh/MocA family oxidoreductase [Thermoguttaceae bacterium]